MIVNHAKHRRFKEGLEALSPGGKPLMNLAKVSLHQVVVIHVCARVKKITKRLLFYCAALAVWVAHLSECFAHGRKINTPLIVVYGVFY